MRKLLIGAAALVMSGSMALAGEGLGLKVDVGLDIGVVESVEIFDGHVDGSSAALVTSLAVTKRFTEEWSASLWLRGVFGFEDDSADLYHADGSEQLTAFDIGGLAGYTLKVNDQFSVTPLAGLSWRSYSVDVDFDDGTDLTEDAGLLVLDLGTRTAYRLTDQLSITSGLMLGLGIAGSAEIGGDGDADGDLDGISLLLELKGGVEYRLTDMASLTGGLAYEVTSVTWDWDDIDDTEDDELVRFSFQFGAVFRF